MRISSPSIKKHVVAELQIGLGVMRRAQEESEQEQTEQERFAEHLVQFFDWYPGAGGVEREVHMVLERCEFQLDEMIRTVQDARCTYERQRRMSARPL